MISVVFCKLSASIEILEISIHITYLFMRSFHVRASTYKQVPYENRNNSTVFVLAGANTIA